MKRRSRAGGEPIKGRRPKAVTPKRPTALKPAPDRGLQEQLDHRTRELSEALEQQTATSEVLRIISSSPGDLKPVFAVILENATRLCQANFGALYLCEGDAYRTVAMHNAPRAFVEARKREPLVSMTGTTVLARVARTKRTIQVADMAEDPAYRNNPQNTELFVRLAGARSVVWVPMLKKKVLIGTIVIFRQEVRSFTDKQIELVQNFAAQAVIAIENARLLNELRQRTTDLTERTADLTEALGQQTATSEVLQVISSSPGDLEPVFETMLENAVRICDAKFGNIYRWDDDQLHLIAMHNTPPAFAEARRRSPHRRVDMNRAATRMLEIRAPVQVIDAAVAPGYLDRSDLAVVEAVELGSVRTLLGVPMLKESELIGAFTLYRQEVRPFTDKQIALVTNFAAQAVIAIENARLLNELRKRTDDLSHRTTDLTEALEQQTATSEVLKVISSSPAELQAVFDAMLDKAVRICRADAASLFLYENGMVRRAARHSSVADAILPIAPSAKSGTMRSIVTKQIVHIEDYLAEPSYLDGDEYVVAAAERLGLRASLHVPMLREQEVVGAFTIWRTEAGAFTAKQIELVTNFAAQAVIAIENARLLNELRQSLERQTATSEVLQIISSSRGDLGPVFRAMLENATRICETRYGLLYLYDGHHFSLTTHIGAGSEWVEVMTRCPVSPPHPDTILGRIVVSKAVVEIGDARKERGYIERHPLWVAAVEQGGALSLLGVPMLKDNVLVGAFVIFRQEVRPFTDKQIELVKNFAAQGVIAIENARLLNELRERTDEVEKLNRHLEQRVTDQVDEIERMSRLRRFLPPQVADLIVASGSEKQLESHRREITALFCDLRGFTGFTESADAEDVMALLRDYHEAIGEIIIKYNGTLERYAGDGVMVIFNDPVPVDNPALQAVLMALEVRDALGALTATWSRLGHDIGFGIGIAHGFATLGTIGFEGRFDYAAIGTVSNVASRLCDEAKPGQILISPRVLTKVENAVKVEPVGEFELKGIRRPLAAYNLVAIQSSEK